MEEDSDRLRAWCKSSRVHIKRDLAWWYSFHSCRDVCEIYWNWLNSKFRKRAVNVIASLKLKQKLWELFEETMEIEWKCLSTSRCLTQRKHFGRSHKVCLLRLCILSFSWQSRIHIKYFSIIVYLRTKTSNPNYATAMHRNFDGCYFIETVSLSQRTSNILEMTCACQVQHQIPIRVRYFDVLPQLFALSINSITIIAAQYNIYPFISFHR